jgi:hypothetical protein
MYIYIYICVCVCVCVCMCVYIYQEDENAESAAHYSKALSSYISAPIYFLSYDILVVQN